MPNLATVLKAEISRLARRELRGELDALRKTAAAQRTEISALKRQVSALDKLSRFQAKVMRQLTTPEAPDQSTAKERALRFSASGLAKQRARLELSAEQFGRLLRTSGQSIYAWEQGRTVPKASNLRAIAELRGLGKRAVWAKLEELASA